MDSSPPRLLGMVEPSLTGSWLSRARWEVCEVDGALILLGDIHVNVRSS